MDELELSALIGRLGSSNNKDGYAALQELLRISDASAAIYSSIGIFIDMLENENSYVRTRALSLIVANAKWDEEGVIDEHLDGILVHVEDPKPITARKFIQTLPNLVRSKPALRATILDALRNVQTKDYPSSMRPLVEGDIMEALLEIDSQDFTS